MNQQSTGVLEFAAVILAAGTSSRMGRPKLLLPWGRTTVLGHVIECWQKIRACQVAVVVGTAAKPLFRELDRLHFSTDNRIPNPNVERGMFSSIQCASAWTGWSPTLTHFVIALGDQPQIRTETLFSLLAFGASNPSRICQPRYNSRWRHPILLPKAAFAGVQKSPVQDMKTYLEIHAASRMGFEVADPGLDLDLDTPDDYERLRSRCFPKA